MNPTAELLTELFKRLNKENVVYCVLRNYEKLPQEVGHDIDIWVNKKDEMKFQKILLTTAQDVGWEIVRYAPWWSKRGQGRYFFINYHDKLYILHIDCFVSLHCKGISYVDEQIIAKSLHFYRKGFYVPSAGIEASTMLFPWLLREGRIREKYKERIRNIVITNCNSFLEAINKPFGKEIATTIQEIIKAENWNKLEKIRGFLWWTLIKRSLLNKPLSQLRNWLLYFYSRLKEHLFEDLGIFLVLLGPDGSGKTATAKAILESEEIQKLFQMKRYFHGRFSYIPELKTIISFFKINRKKHFISTENHVFYSDEFGILRSIIYPLYYSLDYLLGHFLIRKIKAYYSIAIFDRYFYDYWIQKKYIKCPKWLLSLIGKIIPKPDIVIYLKNDPQVIFARKQDLPLQEIIRQTKVCEELIRNVPNGVTIDASHNLEDVVKQVKKIIIDKVKSKWKRSAGYKYITRSLMSL
jgi:thymidylate kinase